jgi:hypothetical protein
MKVISRQIYLYYFHISKLNELKVVNDLYFQYLTQTLSKMTSNTKPDRWEYTIRMTGQCMQTKLEVALQIKREKNVDRNHLTIMPCCDATIPIKTHLTTMP